MSTDAALGPVSRRLALARALWVAVALLAAGLFVASLPGYRSGFILVAHVDAPPEFVSAFQNVSALISIASALLCLTLAVLLFWRKPADGMALFVSFYLLGYGTIMAGPLEAFEQTLRQPVGISVILQTVLLTTPTLALFFLFPNGRFVPRWTRYLTWLSTFIPSVAFLSSPEDLLAFRTPATWVAYGGLALILIAATYSQVYRYRFVSSPVERQQTKWVLLGFLLWLLLMTLNGIPYLYLQRMPAGAARPWWAVAGSALWWISLSIVPLALTFATLRYRLFDIDIIIRRTLTYALVVALLALVYFASVISLQQLFASATGQRSEVITVLSTLIIAALFIPLRNRIHSLIDRRFFRRKYDAQQVLQEFAQAVRDETNLENLTGHLLQVVDETMQPRTASLWLSRTADPRASSNSGNQVPQ